MKKPAKEAESFQETKQAIEPTSDIDAMVNDLRNKTSLARFNHDEAKAVFQYMIDSGYTIGMPA
jgi:hypothetical protein